MTEILIHAIEDTAILIPVLLVVHLLIELFEVKKFGKLRSGGVLGGPLAPLVGTGVGLLPQCGFSVVAAELYSRRYIRAGTLIAVFVATSDEALPIMLGAAATDPSVWGRLGLLIGIKVVMALAAGYLINFLTRRRELTQTPYREEDMPHEHGCCGHSLEHDHAHGADHDAEDGEEHVETRGEKAKRIFVTYFKHPLIHTAVITLFIFIVNLILGGIMHFAEDAAREFMQGSIWLQPLLATLVGLIPNCAASVVITQLFVNDALTLGAAVAGLAVNAGLGLAVLFKENKNRRVDLAITGGLVLYALAVGYALTPIAFV